MTAFLYYCVVLPISRLPMIALYRLSDLCFFLVFHGVRYRKKVVYENLRRSFPEKSVEEIDSIAKGFYRHFCDLIFESVKAYTISEGEIRKRMVCVNPEILDRYFEAGKSVILVGGHYNNWEWYALAAQLSVRHSAVAIYKPLSNRFLDEKMRSTRQKYGLTMLAIPKVPEFFAALRRDDGLQPPPTMVVFAADQSPGDGRKAHWIRFLGQETAAIFGPEKYARECDLPVLYGTMEKKKRGYYEYTLHEMVEDPKAVSHGAIIEKFNRLLEEEIRREPRYWLWSHRRWKHRKPSE